MVSRNEKVSVRRAVLAGNYSENQQKLATTRANLDNAKFCLIEAPSTMSTMVNKREGKPQHHYLNNNDNNTKTRSVTFKKKSSVRSVIRATELADDPDALWYQPQDYDRINEKVVSIVRIIDNEGYQKTGKKQLCLRGLEKHFAEACRVSHERARFAMDCVLQEQSVQRSRTGEFSSLLNEQALATLYKAASTHSRREAREQGMADSLEVRKYLKSVSAKKSTK